MKKITGIIIFCISLGFTGFATKKAESKTSLKTSADSLITSKPDTVKNEVQQKVFFPTPFIVFPFLETEFK